MDQIAYKLFKRYTETKPASESMWYGPWNTILTGMFPSSKGYIVVPQRKVIDNDNTSTIPDFIIEIMHVNDETRIVLVVEIKNSQHWPHGITVLERQLARQVDIAFSESAHTRVYYIMTIGPHWRWGYADDGNPLINCSDWEDTIHESYSELLTMADKVYSLTSE